MVSASLLLLALAAAPQSAPRHDPNETICVRQTDTASRIAGPQMCHTWAEWEDYRRELRRTVDRVQARTDRGCTVMRGRPC